MAKDAAAVRGFEEGARVQADGPAGGKGTVRFAGAVPIGGGKARHFVGVEWDERGRGKNDGSASGQRFFSCGEGMGSFVHPKRLERGVSLLEAVDAKYRSAFEAADKERSLVAQNKPGGRTFEVPVVFAGHKETHEKLKDVARLTHVVLNDACVARLGEPGSLAALLPACTELDLGNNLLTSWDDVALCTEELPLAELRLSSNHLGAPGTVPVPRFAASGSLARLERLFLNRVPGAWRHAALLDAAGCLPALVELHACVNGLARFGGDDPAAPVAGFARLEFLNLTENAIEDWAEVERLRYLPSLRRLMLNGNRLREVRYPPRDEKDAAVPFAALEWISLRDNDLQEWSSVDRLNDFPALREIGMLRNPVSAKQSERETRIEVIARVHGLRVMNHSEVSRRERDDAEKLYLKRCAQAALREKREHADPALHPRYRELLEQFGYPPGVKDEGPAKSALKGRLLVVRVFDGDSPDAPCKTKKVPKTMTVGNLKALIMRLFKVPPPRQELLFDDEAGGDPVPLDDNIKQLGFYNIEADARIVLRRV